MIQPPVQLAPDATSNTISPSKTARPDTQADSTVRLPPAKRMPLSELTTLRPPTAESSLLIPDGGRGSPLKGACSSHYPPPPTFTAADIQQHLSSIQKTSSQPRPALMTPKPSPLMNEVLSSPPLYEPTSNELSDLEFPPDNGSKPTHSYATLIGMAILRAPERKLTLSAIYSWISSSFKYYSASDSGWQNSIRHNLSLNKAFVKVERPKDEPGKGHYWTVENGCEGQFLKGRVIKKLNAAVNRHTPSERKESKKRRVEFDELPRMKRISSSPFDDIASFKRAATSVPASPPPTDNKRKRDTVWDYTANSSTSFSPSAQQVTDEDIALFEDFPSRSEMYTKELSYSANALDLVLSPPPSSSPARHDKVGILGPRTPAIGVKKVPIASPGASLREHRQHMLQMLASPDTENFGFDTEDDPWLFNTPKPQQKSLSMLDSPWDEVAERAAFGSPDKRESRRRESRRSLVCGLHAQELYETGFESSNMPGVNVLDIMKREVARAKSSSALRPSMMERSQSSLF